MEEGLQADAALPRNALLPDESVQKILLSATPKFTGHFSSENLWISHAWPAMHTGRADWFREESPLSRTAFVLSFRTVRPVELPGFVIPNFESSGHIVSSVLSVFFGKRFDVHGPYEMSGSYGVPDMSLFSVAVSRSLPHNSFRARADFPVPLELSKAERIQPLLMLGHPDEKGRDAFLGAARFYQRALQAFEDDPEVAYLHLITAGEIIANHKPFIDAEHLDKDTRDALQRIETEMPGGEKLARFLKGRVRGIKRRFVGTITGAIDGDFFERREADHAYSAFSAEGFARRIEAAYDLRSQNVHTGRSFGGWITNRGDNAEIQSGEPVVDDKEFRRALHNAPLFVGLERVIRHTLLKFAEELGCDFSNLQASAPDSSSASG